MKRNISSSSVTITACKWLYIVSSVNYRARDFWPVILILYIDVSSMSSSHSRCPRICAILLFWTPLLSCLHTPRARLAYVSSLQEGSETGCLRVIPREGRQLCSNTFQRDFFSPAVWCVIILGVWSHLMLLLLLRYMLFSNAITFLSCQTEQFDVI